jgi:hypothetical protein
MKNNLSKRVDSIIIDIDNMVEDLRQERNSWPDRFNECDKIRLKELISISQKLKRISNKILN